MDNLTQKTAKSQGEENQRGGKNLANQESRFRFAKLGARIDGFITTITKPPSQDEQYNGPGASISNAWENITNYRPVVVLITLVFFAITSILLWRWYYEEAKPDTVMAFFTAVLAFTTISQWGIMRRQTRQTDQIVQQMRLEKRAWLQINRVYIEKLEEDKEVKICIRVKNFGDTPGKIIAGTVRPILKPFDVPQSKVVEDFEKLGFIDFDEWLVIPGDPVTLTIDPMPAVEQGKADMVNRGQMQFLVICRFIYEDISRDRTELKGLYLYNHESPPNTFTCKNYCSFP